MDLSLAKLAFNYALGRMGEASTWASITAGAAAQMHLHLNPDFDSALVRVGLALTALAGVVIKEGWQAKGETK